MNGQSLSARLAVCSWSLQPTTPRELIAAVQPTGVDRVQLALDPLREQSDVWGNTQGPFIKAGVQA